MLAKPNCYNLANQPFSHFHQNLMFQIALVFISPTWKLQPKVNFRIFAPAAAHAISSTMQQKKSLYAPPSWFVPENCKSFTIENKSACVCEWKWSETATTSPHHHSLISIAKLALLLHLIFASSVCVCVLRKAENRVENQVLLETGWKLAKAGTFFSFVFRNFSSWLRFLHFCVFFSPLLKYWISGSLFGYHHWFCWWWVEKVQKVLKRALESLKFKYKTCGKRISSNRELAVRVIEEIACWFESSWWVDTDWMFWVSNKR